MKNSKVSRKIYIFLTLILLCSVITYFAAGTLARYHSEAVATATVDIAKWEVKLDAQDMVASSVTVTPTVTLENNAYVAQNRIAPGTTGYFSVELDPAGSEVSIDYVVTVDVTNISGISDSTSAISLSEIQYTIGNDSPAIASPDFNNSFTIFEPLAKVVSGDKVAIDFTIEWDNENDANSSGDTNNGLTGNEITIPVLITAKQHIGV